MSVKFVSRTILAAGKAAFTADRIGQIVTVTDEGAHGTLYRAWGTGAGEIELVVDVDSEWLVHVLARQNTPPVPAPTEGDRYLIGDTPTGVWATHAEEIVTWTSGAWAYVGGTVGVVLLEITTFGIWIFEDPAWALYGHGLYIAQSANNNALIALYDQTAEPTLDTPPAGNLAFAGWLNDDDELSICVRTPADVQQSFNIGN